MIIWDAKNNRPMKKSEIPEITGLTLRELQELAKKHGVKYAGLRKAELADALKEVI